MKNVLFGSIVILSLVGCGGPPSVDDLINNPDKLAKIITNCQMKQMQGKGGDTVECKNANEAIKKISGNMMNQFGR